MQEDDKFTLLQQKTCRLALFCLALLTVVGLVGAGLYGLGHLFISLEPVLLPIVVAGVMAYLLYPSVLWVQRRVKRRLPAVLIVLSGTAILISGLGMSIVPPLVRQTGELVAKRRQIMESVADAGQALLNSNAFVQQVVDTLYNKTVQDAAAEELPAVVQKELADAGSYTSKVAAIIEYNSGYLTEKVIEWLTIGTRAVSGAATFLIGAVMVPVFLFYFLSESEKIERHWHKLLPLRRSRFREEVVETLRQINGYIVSFVRGQMLVSLIDGVLLGIALKIMGLPYAVTIAAAAALLGIIPYIGMISTGIPALMIAWFTWHSFGSVAVVAAIFIGVSQFDGWVIQPRIIGNRVGMHDMTIMFSVLFWAVVLGGIVGALLAVPLTAAIKVIFTRYIWSAHLGTDTSDKKPVHHRRRRKHYSAPSRESGTR